MTKKKEVEEVIFSSEDFNKERMKIIIDCEKIEEKIKNLYNKKVIPELGGALTYISLLEKLLKSI